MKEVVKSKPSLNPCHTEAKAILKGLECVEQLQMQNVRVLTDCMEVIAALRDYPFCKLELITICNDIRMLASRLNCCIVEKYSRDRLAMAHKLATEARKNG